MLRTNLYRGGCMKGKHEIIVSNRDINFRFSIERNITLVVGNSATGKTTLYNLNG